MQVGTQMRDKLAIAAARAADQKKNKAKRSIILSIADKYDKGVGVKHRKDWDARLKFRTYNNLVNEDIL